MEQSLQYAQALFSVACSFVVLIKKFAYPILVPSLLAGAYGACRKSILRHVAGATGEKAPSLADQETIINNLLACIAC